MSDDNAIEAVSPGKSRKCTDVLCLLLFVGFWAGMIALVHNGFTRGDPDRLIYALDYKFDQCNRDNSAAARGVDTLSQTVTNADGSVSKELLLGGRDHSAAPLFIVLGPGPKRFSAKYVGVCMDECPNEGGTSMQYKPQDWVCTGYYYAKENRPKDLTDGDWPQIESFSKDDIDKFVSEVKALGENKKKEVEAQYKYLKSFFMIKTKGECPDTADPDAEECSVCYPVYPTTKVGTSFCFPDPNWIAQNKGKVKAAFGAAYSLDFINDAAKSFFGDGGSITMRVMADAYAARWVMVGCIGGAVLLGFVWTYLVRLFIRPMVAITIVGVFVALAVTTYTLYNKQEELRADPLYQNDDAFTTIADFTFGFFVFAAVCFVAYMVTICCLWRKIFLAVGVIIEAAKAMKDMPGMLIVPLFPALITFGLLIYMIIGAFYIASTGELKLDGNGYAQIQYDNTMKGMLAYHFFGYVWTSVFLNHLGWMVIAAAVANWYFAKPSDDGKDIGATPVLSAAKRVLWYHPGSAVFGSLIVAIIRYIRYMMHFLKRYFTVDNPCIGKLVKCIWCCIDCCLRCFEKIMEFISRNGYVIVVAESSSFCPAARTAFGYILSNLGGVAMVQTIGDIFLFLGKLFVALAAAGICGMVLTFAPAFRLSQTSIVLPCLIVLVAAYLIAAMFMGIFEMAIDTIFMCFCIDEDKQLGYADGALKGFIKANAPKADEDRVAPNASPKGSATAAAPMERPVPADSDDVDLSG